MKIYKIMNKKKVIGYAVGKSRIRLKDPIYKICRSESDNIKEGGCYYPHVCRKISLDAGLSITKDKVLVPVECEISLDNNKTIVLNTPCIKCDGDHIYVNHIYRRYVELFGYKIVLNNKDDKLVICK